MKTQTTRFTKSQLSTLLSAYYNGTSYIGIEDADALQTPLPQNVASDPRGAVRKVGAGFTCPSKFFVVHTRNLDSIATLAAAGAKTLRLRDCTVRWADVVRSAVALAFDDPTDTITWANSNADPAAHAFMCYGTTLPAPLQTRTLYYIVNVTAAGFQLSLTPGGAPIALSGSTASAFGCLVNMSKCHPDGASGLLDKLVNTASGLGMDIIYDCSGVPASISKDGTQNNRPSVSTHVTNYCGFLKNRYSDKITHYEIWNEPNDAIQWTGTSTGNSNDLVMYTSQWKAARDLFSSTAKIITPSFNVSTGVALMDAWLQTTDGVNSAATLCDIFGFHPYRGGNVQLGYSNEILDQYIAVANARMAGKEIWITEVGESYPNEAILWRSHAYAMARGVARLGWYDYDMSAGKGDMRLTSYDGLAAAYQSMISKCAGQTISYVNQLYDRRCAVGVGGFSAIF